MSSLFLFTHTQTKDGRSQSQIQSDVHEKLKEISEKIKRDGISLPEILRPLTQCAVADCVIGPSHIAMRLEVLLFFSYFQGWPRLQDWRGKLGDSRTGGSASLRDGSSAAVRGSSGGPCARSIRSPLNLLSRSSRGINLPREMQRQGICLSRPLASRIPASEVPESFIEQCQTVLQGKSRQLIIRELQRTNLDVNMTVNNLLSMDDEADQSGGNAGGAGTGSGGANSADDWEDDTEDLLSLLEHPEGHFLFEPDSLVGEEFFGPVRYRTDISQDYDYSFVSDRRKRRRLDTHLYLRGSEIYTNRSSVTGGAGIGESSGRSNVLDPLHPLNFHVVAYFRFN
ncbi:unnamed protein product [Protopolystoma xenopodis]|uniref:E3 ubiquitin-protein ligase UBR5 ubiquitin-associated domain-containing protein n=1 Tax=Protopolystoma xenopodis TaxID=117903 RepID=A0A3S5AH65_9PLAT|nr:unnamed protein product [Protopolystoma xenopodis]